MSKTNKVFNVNRRIKRILAAVVSIACSYLGAFAAVRLGMSVCGSSADYVIDYFVIHPVLILAVCAGAAAVYSVILKKLAQSETPETVCFILGLVLFTWMQTRRMLNKYSFCVLYLNLCIGKSNLLLQGFAVPKIMTASPELFMFAVFLFYLCIPVFIYNACSLFLTFKSDDYMPKTKPILGMLISAGIWILLEMIF